MASEIQKRPLSRDPWAEAVGLEVRDVQADTVSVRTPCNDFNRNLRGIMHGGVIAGSLLRAGELLMPEHRALDVRVDFLRPVTDGAAHVEARLHRRTRRFGFAGAELRDDEDRVCAIAQLSFAPGGEALRHSSPLQRPATQGDVTLSTTFKRGFDRYLRSLEQGMSMARMAPGVSEVAQAPAPAVLSDAGAVAPAHLMKLIDSTGGACAVARLESVGQAATVGMHVSFCAPVPRGPLRALGHTTSQSGDVTLNEVCVIGGDDGEVVAVGLVTHLGREAGR